MAADNAPPIVKRVKKKGHDGHHGGAWKVAYADFVTAMMAFFLLMWLINATTEEQKRGIAEYFSPVPGMIGQTTGGSGFFKGDTVASDGKSVNQNAPPSVTIPIPTTPEQGQTQSENDKQGADSDNDFEKNGNKDQNKDQDKQKESVADAEQAAKVLAEAENKQFKEAEFELKQAIQNTPDLKDLAQNLIVDNTPDGLRIQIVDQEKLAMFPRGSTVMADKAKLLMAKVAEIIKKFPEKIAISGHTDSTQYAEGNKYDNWDLSTDRANASRRALIDAGLPAERITNLAGKGDTEPLVKDDPDSPKNRRISIVLLRQNPLTAKAAAGADAAAPPTQAPAPAPAQAPAQSAPPKQQAATPPKG